MTSIGIKLPPWAVAAGWPPPWPGTETLVRAALATLAIAGLLLALTQAIQATVRQADLRHADAAERASASGRCNVLAQRDLREACRSDIKPLPHEPRTAP